MASLAFVCMSDDEPTTPPTDPFPFRFSAAIFLLYVSAFLFHFPPPVWSHSRVLAFCIPPRIRLPLRCAKPFRFSLAHSCALSFPFYSSHPLRAHTSTTATIDAFGRSLPKFPSPPSLALTYAVSHPFHPEAQITHFSPCYYWIKLAQSSSPMSAPIPGSIKGTEVLSPSYLPFSLSSSAGIRLQKLKTKHQQRNTFPNMDA